jgi:hypothetical protein
MIAIETTHSAAIASAISSGRLNQMLEFYAKTYILKNKKCSISDIDVAMPLRLQRVEFGAGMR